MNTEMNNEMDARVSPSLSPSETEGTVKIAVMTHRGAVRAENQDALCVAEKTWTGDMSSPQVVEAKFPLLLAAVDGMGGHKGGARAARILAGSLSQGAAFGAELDLEADKRAVRSLLEDAARQMESAARQDPELASMGATVSGVVLREKNAFVFNCGDCRVYRFSEGGLERLTRDHSVVQVLFENGEIQEEEMRFHPRKNIVTSAVSADSDVPFELYAKGVSRCESDVFFLCSDGVWEALDTPQLAQRLTPSELPVARRAADLFDALLSADCRDNVSFLWQTT
ncbi:MAG: protein phosphatase 2C domain-containing protein [Synergistaceae bacterium]|nr:protein phosphatase 2C domain-containing protein [Synergistaceae bacterium]